MDCGIFAVWYFHLFLEILKGGSAIRHPRVMFVDKNMLNWYHNFFPILHIITVPIRLHTCYFTPQSVCLHVYWLQNSGMTGIYFYLSCQNILSKIYNYVKLPNSIFIWHVLNVCKMDAHRLVWLKLCEPVYISTFLH